MGDKETTNWQPKLASFLAVATIFLMAVTAVTAVEFFNRLKENRYIGRDMEFRNEITVSGQAEKFVRPDLALVVLGIKTEGKTVEEVMSENTRAMNGVIEVLKDEIGLPEGDLRTTQFNLSPRYEWHEQREGIRGERVLVGYEANQSLEVKVRDFDQIGQIIERATARGANQVGELRFDLEDEELTKKEIRAEAIAQARSKARDLAEQLDVRLVRVTNFREDVPAIPWARGMAEMMYSDSAEPAGAPSIQPGENKVEVSVSITYEIN